MVYQLIYSSRARTSVVHASDLRSMLIDFRAHNARVGITGILLYGFRRFLQLIEGEQEEVDALFARIERDRRHTNIELLDCQLPGRLFGDWSMAFVDLDAAAQSMPGFAGRPPNMDLRLIYEEIAEEMLNFFSVHLANSAQVGSRLSASR